MPATDEGPFHEQQPGPDASDRSVSRKLFPAHDVRSSYWEAITLAAFLLGVGLGYLLWGRGVGRVAPDAERVTTAEGVTGSTERTQESRGPSLAAEVNPPNGYTLPLSYGDIGPQLIAAGAIDAARFQTVFERTGQPLDENQLAILREGSETPVTINRQNARFLLNLLWVLGLTNRNPVLEAGPMVQYSQGQIGRFASTGGWTLGQKPTVKLYSSTSILPLTPEQQAQLNEVAAAVYRPCCNNPTHFPDCNHGMAMLGLLELMAFDDASVEEMFAAARAFNAFWFPQQYLELAAFFEVTQGQKFAEIDPRRVVGAQYTSAAGFQAVHQWLVENGALELAPANDSGCGV